MQAHCAGPQGEDPTVELLQSLLAEQRKANDILSTMHHELREMKVRLNDMAR